MAQRRTGRDEDEHLGVAPGDVAGSVGGDVDSSWDRKRRQVLDGAAVVFSERGYSKGTTKEIAAQIGLSQPSLYHYVGSKADLLREIALQVDRDMLGALDRGLTAGDDAVTQLRGIIHEFTRAVVANRFTFAVYRKEIRSLEPEMAAKIQADERNFISAVERVVERAQALGALPAGSPSVLTYGILNMVSEAYRWYRPDGPLDPDAVADTFCTLIGIGAASA